jgi:mono/diheme cytochrome c family protein
MAARLRTVLALVSLALAIGGASFRIWNQFVDPTDPRVPRYALGDFRDAVYYATVAFFAGDNPYDQSTYVPKYPVGERCSLYSPLSFVMHAPLALLPFPAAALVFYALSLASTVALGALCLWFAGVEPTVGRVAGLGAFLIASRPGLMNLFNGQVTLEAVLTAYVALWYARERPWLAAVALAAATFKGTYGVPLAALMFVRGDRRTVALAVLLGTLITVPAAARLAHAVGGVSQLAHTLHADYDSRSTIAVKRAENAPFRIDAVALAARIIGRSPTTAETLLLSCAVFGMSVAGLVAMRRQRPHAAVVATDDRDRRLHATSVAALAIVAGLYHQAYDALALALPLVVLWWRPDAEPWRAHPGWRWVVLGLLLVPFVNYFSAEFVVARLRLGDAGQLAASSVSAAAILGALAAHVALAFRWVRLDETMGADMNGPRMRSLAGVGMVVVLLLGTPAARAAAADSDTTLSFVRDGATVKTIDRARLEHDCHPVTVAIDDAYYGRRMHYRACPLAEALQLGFGTLDAAATEGTDLFFRARDGYVKPAPVARVLEPGGYLAFADADRMHDDDPGWQPIDRRKVDPGPYYVVWERPGQSDAHGYPWPYQLVAIELTSYAKRYPHIAPAGVPADAPAWAGFTIFRSECISCHAVNGEGGTIGPDLNVPQSIVEYRPVEQVKAYVKNPQRFRYTNMPAHEYLSDGDLDALIAYFRAMRARKHDPNAGPTPASGAAAAAE